MSGRDRRRESTSDLTYHNRAASIVPSLERPAAHVVLERTLLPSNSARTRLTLGKGKVLTSWAN